MIPPFPAAWEPHLGPLRQSDSFLQLDRFLTGEMAAGRQVLPDTPHLFRALELTPPDSVRAVLLGQDPYPTPGHAHGLCFSVQPHVRPWPGSLRNVFRELNEDLGIPTPPHGCLEAWARQGVLLLNTVLTVPAGDAGGHRGRGWEPLTDAIIQTVAAQPRRVVFLLWGRDAQRKASLIPAEPHRVVATAHPSPLSVRLFRGCRCFSATNRLLAEADRGTIDWTIR